MNLGPTRTFKKKAETFRIICLGDISDYCPESPPKKSGGVFFYKMAD